MIFSEFSKGRVIAIDPGKKRIGVAVSDELQMLVRPVRVITRGNLEKLRDDIEKLIKEFDAVALVIGLPLNFDGSESSGSKEARHLVNALSKHLSIPIHLQNEHLTSHEAETRLRDAGYSPNEIKQRVDMEAAAIILRDFLGQQ